jgi:uncharacterized protein (TIGR03083 family)
MSLDYLAQLRAESARFGTVLRDADLDARVPTCPDWDAGDLLYHLAEVFLFWARDVEQRAQDPDAPDAGTPPKPATRDELVTLYDDCTAQLVNALAATPDDVQVWTWTDDRSVGFVRRRMAHEALIHRLDAELTVGSLTNVDPALAADGVHELLQHFHTHPTWADYRSDGPVGRLRAADTGDEWLAQVGTFSGRSPNTGKTYQDVPCVGLAAAGEPSFTITATARDLDAWAWNRPPLEQPVVEGSDADFRVFADVLATGVQ